jgi:hypothetical protein
MKRIILLAFLAAPVVAGCDEKKTTPQSTTPSAAEMFDKGKSPRGAKVSNKGKPD